MPAAGAARRRPGGSRRLLFRQPRPGSHQPARSAGAAALDGGGTSLQGIGVGACGSGRVLERITGRRCPPGSMDVANVVIRISKTVGVDHAQRRVLVAQPAPEAVKMRARVRSQELGEVPHGVRRDFPGRQHARAERPAMTPDRQIGEIDDLAGQIAQAQQPIEEAAVAPSPKSLSARSRCQWR